MHEIMNTNTTITLKDKLLVEYAVKIAKIGNDFKKNLFKLAVILADMEEAEIDYSKDGYDNMIDFCEKTFGLKKSQIYGLKSIGKDFIDKKTYKSLLPHKTENDYNTTQLQAVSSLGVEKAKELSESERITPDMSCKEILDIVKEVKEEAKTVLAEDGTEVVKEAKPKAEKITKYIVLADTTGGYEVGKELEFTKASLEEWLNTFEFTKTFKDNEKATIHYAEYTSGIIVIKTV